MKAPALNPEIKSALSDNNIKRDAYSEQKQNQINWQSTEFSLVTKRECPPICHKNIGRLLCDIHYRESLCRRFAILNSLSKQKREIIKNTKIDDHLFGSNLSEHLKSSKAISASASELRFNTNTAKFT
ncbi:hypothetical protein SFRURICE_010699 [Spodoptera frugiperda]|nr:hypothetical protein SFRURICE_010699 [Spodoptera frugiperda]